MATAPHRTGARPAGGVGAATPTTAGRAEPDAAGQGDEEHVVIDADDEPLPEVSERAARWASTMHGFSSGAGRRAHRDSDARIGAMALFDRESREQLEDEQLAPLGTRAVGAGSRRRSEVPDPYRTCFERDRDRIVHSSAFRRLAGKTQVFVFPDDHQRTRLTHALEVAQVAKAVATTLRLNVSLTEAIALGHDCGHGPGGHASEEAFAAYLEDGFDHARFGADVTLASLNLTMEVSDGIRNHSWSRPAPATPEGEVVSWADRIAYVCHDFEDAVSAGVVRTDELPGVVRRHVGTTRAAQLRTFIGALIETSAAAGRVEMAGEYADALSVFRTFNYERVYLRPASVAQAKAVIAVLRALVEDLLAKGNSAPDAVAYVAGMTDRYAFDRARARLGYPDDRLPRGIDAPLPEASPRPLD